MSRPRKRHGTQQKRVSFADDVIKPIHEDNWFLAKIYEKKLYLIGITFSVLLLVVVLWPSPKLSAHARNWRDSGYMFKYKQHEIFYQDIFYLSNSIKTNPVLLILHGFPTSSYDWKNLIPKLHKNFPRIIIPDMLGLGFSDKPVGHSYSIMEQATIQEKLLDNLNISEVHILSHNYGDTVAQELIARYNDPAYNMTIRVRSLCLSNGGILPSQHHPLLIQRILMIPVIKSFLTIFINKFVFDSRFPSIFGPETRPSKELLNDFWAIILHKEGHLSLPDILQYIPERHANKERWVRALQDTRVPLHLIYGPMDPINTPDGFLKAYKLLVKQSTYTVLQNIGHYPQLEDEAGFMTSYEDFLRRVLKRI